MKHRVYNTVVFRLDTDSYSGDVTGTILRIEGDTLLVGVTNPTKPRVWSTARKPDGTKVPALVHNNSLWVVPFSSVIETRTSGYVPSVAA